MRGALWFSLVVWACSLQAPTESDLFGTQSAAGGASAGTGARAGHQGGLHPVDGGRTSHGGGDTVESGGGTTAGMTPSGGAAATASSAEGGALAESGAPTVSGGSAAGGGAVVDIDSGLVAYFPFEEANGPIVANVEDQSRSGQCVGSCLRPNGVIGRALRVRNADANVDWVELPPGLLHDLSALTITFWVRVLAKDRKDAPAFHFSRGDAEAIYFTPDDINPSTSRAGAAFGIKYDGELVVSLRGTGSLADESWHHVAVTWDAAAINVLVDGKQLGTKTSPSLLPSALGATTLDYLGRALNDQITAFSGDFDELRIYGRVLDARELQAVFAAR